MTFAEKAIAFYISLQAPSEPLPHSVEIMNPYGDKQTQRIVTQFYEKYFSDSNQRVLVLGINPGRFGGAVTGISFTDPVNLAQYCGIAHTLKPRTELSSQFVYTCIEACGGVAAFYQRFYLGALYPLALVKDGKNYNYYDTPAVFAALKPAIAGSLKKQAGFGSRKSMICLGQKNYTYLQLINQEIQLFDTIHVLEHPRFIMQYRRKQINSYVDKYLSVLENAFSGS